jgi:Asp-tRNA(Asn)/Glu-tRNA(Gln) amidotransferase A subunit family amidase
MTDDDLCYLTASEALILFRKHGLKPSELLAALKKRAAKINPAVNCLADQYWDDAMAMALAADARYGKRGSRLRPLEGVPLAVKDAQRVNGRRTTHGSLIFMEAPPDDHSDPMIERLEKAGAIIFARTTTPEFCLTGTTHSRAWGVTRNPWAPAGAPAAPPAVRVQHLPQASPHSPPARISAAPSASRQAVVASSASSRPMAATPMARPPTSTASTIAAP